MIQYLILEVNMGQSDAKVKPVPVAAGGKKKGPPNGGPWIG